MIKKIKTYLMTIVELFSYMSEILQVDNNCSSICYFAFFNKSTNFYSYIIKPKFIYFFAKLATKLFIFYIFFFSEYFVNEFIKKYEKYIEE